MGSKFENLILFYNHGHQGVIVQSHAVSGMSTRKELTNPFPRCKKQRKTKGLVSSGVFLSTGLSRVCLEWMTDTKKERKRACNGLIRELEGQQQVGCTSQ